MRFSVFAIGILIFIAGAVLAASSAGYLIELPLPLSIAVGSAIELPFIAVGGLIAVVGIIIAAIGIRMF